MMWELVVNVLILIMLFVILYYDFKNRKITSLRFKEIEKKHEELEKIVERNQIIMEEKEEKIWSGLNILDREFTKYRLRK